MRFLTLCLAAMLAAGTASAATGARLTAAPQTPAVLANQNINVNLLVHDTVPARMTAWIGSLGTPRHGSVNWTTSQYVTYTPGAYYAALPKDSSATDSFGYCLTDDAGTSACNTVTVTIFGVYVPPVAPPPPPPPPPVTPPPVTPPPVSSTFYTCASNFYVSPGGNDSSGNGSAASPWASIHGADNSGRLTPGACVNLADGSYGAAGTIAIAHGGSASGYVVYRAINKQKAVIKETSAGTYDVLDVNVNYVVIDGLEIDGGNAGLTSNPKTTGSCLASMNSHHFTAVNNLVHDCGGEGIGAAYGDWYTFAGNTAHDNARFNGYQMSGFSIYEPNAVSYTPNANDLATTYHISVLYNVSYNNAETYVSGNHTDGNGIILDDFQDSQGNNPNVPSGTAYPYKSLVQGNTTHDNGARGVHLFYTSNVTVEGNIAYNNNLDEQIIGTWRGELSNAVGANNTWTNNKATTTSLISGQRASNTAVLDGSLGNTNSGVTWTNNANFDIRTGQRSFSIDTASRASAFSASNPLGGPLP